MLVWLNISVVQRIFNYCTKKTVTHIQNVLRFFAFGQNLRFTANSHFFISCVAFRICLNFSQNPEFNSGLIVITAETTFNEVNYKFGGTGDEQCESLKKRTNA